MLHFPHSKLASDCDVTLKHNNNGAESNLAFWCFLRTKMKMMLSEYEGFCIFGWETIQQKSSRGKSIKVALDLVPLKVTSRIDRPLYPMELMIGVEIESNSPLS